MTIKDVSTIVKNAIKYRIIQHPDAIEIKKVSLTEEETILLNKDPRFTIANAIAWIEI